jgi:hypothetical protein
MVDHFNGEEENMASLDVVSIEEQLRHAAEYEAWKGAGHREGFVGDPSRVHGVKRKSILFKLPYWKVSQHRIAVHQDSNHP